MRSIQAEIDLFPMVLAEEFNYTRFWGGVVGIQETDAFGHEDKLPNRLQVGSTDDAASFVFDQIMLSKVQQTGMTDLPELPCAPQSPARWCTLQ